MCHTVVSSATEEMSQAAKRGISTPFGDYVAVVDRTGKILSQAVTRPPIHTQRVYATEARFPENAARVR